MYYSLASYYSEDLTCYIIEVLKYCTTPYVAPVYTTQAPEYYTTQAPEYYTTQAPEYYTTQAPEYYTLNRGFSLLHYNLRCFKQPH
jgi:hypothetical protein